MPRKPNGCSLLDASVDWFTITTAVGLRSRFAASKADKVMLEWEKKGSVRTPTNRMGFTGDRIDHLFYGYRGDLLIVIASGDVAAQNAPFFLGMAEHVTRLDLAVTLQDSDIDRDWTSIALRQCSMDGRIDSGLLKTHRIIGTPDGATLYVGVRKSARYIRIYDKTAQTKGAYPNRSWRWEIEYKKPLAGVVASKLLRSGSGSGAVLDVVATALADLRITLPVGAIPSGWLPRRPKLLTTDESRLRYASRTIAPFLNGLVEAVGEKRVAEALGRSLFTRDRLISRDTGEVV
jgi:hypothetical protein